VPVCLLDTTANPAKMVEPIEMQFAVHTGLGLWNHVLDGGTCYKGDFMG